MNPKHISPMDCKSCHATIDYELPHIIIGSSLLTEVEPWFHSWYRGRVETLDAKYNLILILDSSLLTVSVAK